MKEPSRAEYLDADQLALRVEIEVNRRANQLDVSHSRLSDTGLEYVSRLEIDVGRVCVGIERHAKHLRVRHARSLLAEPRDGKMCPAQHRSRAADRYSPLRLDSLGQPLNFVAADWAQPLRDL